MKRIIIIITCLSTIFLLASCMGFRTNFKYPTENKNSKWTSTTNDITITMSIDSLGNAYSNISYGDEIRLFETKFSSECMNFTYINDDFEYILEDGSSISVEEYNNNANISLVTTTFTINKTSDKVLDCYITVENFEIIFPNSGINEDAEKLFFTFNMLNNEE